MPENIELKEIILSHIIESKATGLATNTKLETIVINQALQKQSTDQIVKDIKQLGENFTTQNQKLEILEDKVKTAENFLTFVKVIFGTFGIGGIVTFLNTYIQIKK